MAGRGGTRLFGRLGRDWALLALLTAAFLAGVAARLAGASTLSNLLWSAAAGIALVTVLAAVASTLRARRVGVDLLAAVALGGTVAVGEYAAASVIALMVATGRLLESWASARAEADLKRLLQHAPHAVHRYEEGQLADPPLQSVVPGDLLLVKPGEIVPVDGRVESESAVLNMASLTGESLPVSLSSNEVVESGAVNTGGPFDLRAISTAADSTFAAIVQMVSGAVSERAPFVRLADRFAAAFIPVSLALAAVAWAVTGSAVRAVAVLVVATPCPLILAAPIAMVAGISRLSRLGVIVKGGGVLERLATARVLVFDKTGTVTRGEPRVTEVVPATGLSADEVLRYAASLEQISSHVLASALVRSAAERRLALSWPSQAEELFGAGAAGLVDGLRVRVGRAEWLGQARSSFTRRIRRRAELESLMSIYVEVDGRFAGAVLLEDPLRPDAARCIRELRSAGVGRVVMATGDKSAVANTVGEVLGVDQVLAERSPAEKVEVVRLERVRGTTVMVGDGVNDAPVLAVADVGIALGARGASASSDAADVVVTVDRVDRVVDVLRVAHRSRRIALESVTAGMAMSLAAMAVAAMGFLPALPGAIVQEGIDLIVIVNALRTLLRPRGATGFSSAEAELGRRLAEEHTQLAPQLAEIREVADKLEELAPKDACSRLYALERFLVDELLPHERLEQEEFYPVVARLVGGRDPVGPMTRAHVEIAHLASVFSRILEDLAESGPDEDQRRDLRRVLYGLHAVLVLHFAQEDEGYLSIVPEAGEASPGRAERHLAGRQA